MEWAAAAPPTVAVIAPMCVQATYFTQFDREGRRLVVHLFNGVNTTAHHGQAAADVPLREETIPIHGIQLRFEGKAPKRCHLEPGGRELPLRRQGSTWSVEVPTLEIHELMVAEY